MPKHQKKYQGKMLRELSGLWNKDVRTVVKYLDDRNLLITHPETAKIFKKYKFSWKGEAKLEPTL